MMPKPRQIAPLILLLASAFCAQMALGKKKDKPAPPSQMSEQKRAVHALNRLSFGPRPGDVDRVMAMGVDQWIDEQLHPARVDDSALSARLAPLRTLNMSPREMVENFPPPQVIKAVADGKLSLPSDPVKRAIYQAQLDRLEVRREEKEEAGGAKTAEAAGNDKPAEAGNDGDGNAAQLETRELLEMPPDQRVHAVLQMTSQERHALPAALRGKRDEFFEGMSPQQRETVMALNNPQQVVAEELVEGKLLRATYSERQLQEVMTDFWFNHFNVFLAKGPDRYFVSSYERDVIRPHALGKFEDLLVATAQSPAMLFYLDNWLSVGPNSDMANGVAKRDNWRKREKTAGPVQQAKGKRGGLNENYGRELMELHTLGVNGGYTQKDVTEVARVFTGWTVKQPQRGGGFNFDERMHEPGDKVVLGHRIKAKGEKEGLEVLHILARHPATAKFVCTKLAVRFVSDNPPPALVGRMTQTFLKKDGDITAVLKTMLSSPEFWEQDAYRAKVKTPLEFVVSALRASGADMSDALPIARQLQNMGMPLYGMQPPTGYSMKADAWVNSSALLGRMNFGLALASGRLKGTRISLGTDDPPGGDHPMDSAGTLAALENSLLEGDVSQQTHDTIAARLDDPQISRRKLDDPARNPNVGFIAGLLLGSPEFQRR